MVTIRNVNDIIENMRDILTLSQPEADTKPGTVIRNIFIDAPAGQVALLYDEISKVSIQQSLRLVTGSDLDKLAKNFGLIRKSATAANGIALLTFNSLLGTININTGDIVTASNGISFSVLNGISINPAQANFYQSVATKFQNDLTFVGITDTYAVEITAQATTVGVSGNLSKYSLISANSAGISNVTNTQPFIGGSNQEDDSTFRNRILAIFNGSSVGTSLGYKNTALATTGVQDAYVITPGDPLMTRDGTITTTDNQGNITVVSEGAGGKVDIAILGTNLTENVDSFIYQDKSNKNDPTNSKNIVILGQITADANKTINRRRIDDIANGILPAQPVDSILQVTGSGSGTNFQPKTVDSLGRISGNYELLKDVGEFGGSAFGFDSFHWIDNKVSNLQEDKVKGKFNGQDPLTYSDVLAIPQVQQNISITNENSTILPSDRTLIQLQHTPATNVTRVFNVNTGETYTIVNQNPNGTGILNTSGTIKISGNTLPSPSNVLQVDYNWVISFDQYSDFDGRAKTNDNPRSVQDSIDWGYSNVIRSENVIMSLNTSGTLFTGTLLHPISSVVSANIFLEIDGTVNQVMTGIFAGRLSIIIPRLFVATASINNIFFKNTFDELFVTAQNNGTFINTNTVVGIILEYSTTIILPTDTKAQIGDRATVILNKQDVFNITGMTGSFTNNQITIPSSNLNTTATSINLEVSYIANIQNVLTTGVTSLPLSRNGNGFALGNLVVNAGSNVIHKDFQSIQKNLSNQLFLEIVLSSIDVSFPQIISIVRLSDGLELWNNDNVGSITINGTTNNYQLILNGFNSPAIGDRALILFFANDFNRFQPSTFENGIIEKNFDSLQFDNVSKTFSTHIHQFTSGNAISFQILEPNTDIILISGNDGYLASNGISAFFSSLSIHFNNILNNLGQPVDITSKKIRLIGSNNSGTYDITQFTQQTNILTISNDFSKISNKQVSIIRLLDGQDLWPSAFGSINVANNSLSFPATSNANALDKVIILFSNEHNLKQSPTRLSLNISDQVINTGTLSVIGDTITKSLNVVFTATNSGLKQNIIEALRMALGINSNITIPNNIQLVKIAKLEKVSTAGNNDVLNVISTYDLIGTTILNNSFYHQFFEDLSFGPFDFVLPKTVNNTSFAPKIGDKLRITFYYLINNDTENVSFTRNGTLFTNKAFAFINKVFISSGLNSSKSAQLTIGNFNQPISGSRYRSFYDYLAPKINERIIIRSNFNKIISDTTFNIEASRPINADVLVFEADQILIDVSMNIMISSSSTTSEAIILQNLKDSLTAAINSTGLGTSLSSSSLVNTAFSISGVTGARILLFNKSGNPGQVLKIQAHNNQYLVANNVIVNVEGS